MIVATRTVVCVGLCFSTWLALLSISLEVSLTNPSHQDGWTLQWIIRAQHRVQIESPLMKACQKGDVLLIRQILKERRGGVNDRSICSGKTPLLVAIDGKHLDVVECLLQNGADPNLSDDDQVTPLFAIAGMDFRKNEYFDQLPPTWELWLDTFRLLIKHGAFLRESVRGRHIASLNIVRNDRPSKVLEYLGLLAAEDVPRSDVVSGHECWPGLQNALRSGSDAVDALELLHSSGVDLSKVMDDGRTALHVAAEWCLNSEPLEYLYLIGCQKDINKQDQWDWTALHYATIARNSAVSTNPFSKVVSLVRHGADMKIKGGKNAWNHYGQPEGRFTPIDLLSFARPSRFDLLMHVFRNLNMHVGVEVDEDTLNDAQEPMSDQL